MRVFRPSPLALVVLPMLAVAAPAWAQQPPARPPACQAADHRAFDFWVGEWTVRDSAGRELGRSTIERIAGGCGLREHWRGGPGGTGPSGQSLNFWDPADRRWHQVWVGTGSVLRLAGNVADGAMVLEGDSPAPGGAVARNRIRWSPQPDGRVRQTWTVSADSGRTWRTSFDGWYGKR